jgi:NAD(P)-dependent dehydrogenase (short-subunit alcohol dehydrogenase family)
MQIQGATALVAGGASGLGAATARRLAEAGANVTIADLNEEKGEALAQELGARFVRCDVTEPEQVEAAVPEGVRISVCCAGVGWAELAAGVVLVQTVHVELRAGAELARDCVRLADAELAN